MARYGDALRSAWNAPCEGNGQACVLGGALLIIPTDLGLGLPGLAIMVMTGGVSPPAVAVEILETVVVLPVNILGIFMIKRGLEAEELQR